MTEIRRVKPNWEHPKCLRETLREGIKEAYYPMTDSSYKEAIKDYKTELIEWIEKSNLFMQGKALLYVSKEDKKKIVNLEEWCDYYLAYVEKERKKYGFGKSFRELETEKYRRHLVRLEDVVGDPPTYPNIDDYMPTGDWFQFYETVSEGTPLTPPFKTLVELGQWLTNNKDYWGRQWDEMAVKDLIENEGDTASFIVSDGVIYDATEQYKLKDNN